MPPRSEEPLTKIHIRLFESDIEALREFYPNAGYNVAIRQLVRKHVRALQDRLARGGASPDLNLDLE